MSGRDEPLGRERDEVEGRQEAAEEARRDRGRVEPGERPPAEAQAEANLLKSSGGNPFTQESD